MTTSIMSDDRYVELVREAANMRGAIRAAADRGDLPEVERLVHRIAELERSFFAIRYTNIRHNRATNPLGHRGYSPDLERIESELSAMLAKIGQRSHNA
jgi:hypothetical protein